MDPYTENGQCVPDALNPQGFQTLPDLLASACQQYGDQPAFSSLGRTLSYAELDRLSAAFAVWLQTHTDLQPGDRLAIQLPNIIQYPVVVFGALRAGLVVVNTNPLYTADEMEHQFRDSGARALVIHTSMAHKAEAILPRTDIRWTLVTQVGDLHGLLQRTLINGVVKYLRRQQPRFNLPGVIQLRHALNACLGQQPEPVASRPADVAVLQYTGGTTGVAKGVMLSHANLIANALQGQALMAPSGLNWAETVIAPLPLYHIYAFTLTHVVMLTGGHNVLITDPRDLDGFVRTLQRQPFTAFIGLNPLFIALCNHTGFRQLDFSRLCFTCSGGMALTPAVAEQWQQVTGCAIVEGYGLTETSPAALFNQPEQPRIGYIGLPMAETRLQVIDSQEVPVAPGTAGELCIQGPQVMQGYWQRPAATLAAFTAEGYLRTGDIVVQDADGYIRLVDRASDLIVVSGFNVYPAEVETVLNEHPAVSDCAVIGEADDSCGEVVRAVLICQQPVTVEGLQDWCRQRLSGYKVPRTIEFVDELPRTGVGKVLRRALRDSLAGVEP